MSDADKTIPPAAGDSTAADDTALAATKGVSPSPEQQTVNRAEARRWWIKLLLQPLLLLACGVILIVGLGVAQRFGFISAGGSGGHGHATSGEGSTRYICPMMCTPPQAEPGRCPVCAMELVPATAGSGDADARSIHVDPAARRVANIRTVAVTSMPISRTIRAIGELDYDEGTLKTIAAYVDGRLDRLYADYTGVVVTKGDHLALVYSPRLYSSQVELLLAKRSRDGSRSSTLTRVVQSNQDLYESAKQRLVELGMTAPQIEQLEQAGEANSRLHLCAPISGTVIEKMAVEGQYVKEGDAIYQLADLSTVWLMLRLFPEDAATIRYGQKVDAEVQSLPGRRFEGRVAFIDPNVDPKTRTVGIRVVIANDEGLLRVGDYAKATIDVPLSDSDQAIASSESLVVPRDAVLMAGNNSVIYVETEPGRFEIRRVVLGPRVGDAIVIRSGVKLGEQVATRGNFLIDSQMQLAGNPSLIDPSRLEPAGEEAMSPEMLATLSRMSAEDRALVDKQGICPVAEYRLGSMGPPKKVDVNGTPVFICCDGCRERLLSEPEKYLAKLADMSHRQPAHGRAPKTTPEMDLPPIGVPQLIEPEEPEPETIKEATKEANSTEPATKRVAGLPKEALR